jgi:hypothetical protein
LKVSFEAVEINYRLASVNFTNILGALFSVLCSAFLYLQIGFVIFWKENIGAKATCKSKKNIGAKAACKMLMKLTMGLLLPFRTNAPHSDFSLMRNANLLK